jgi:amino acid transporter
VETPGLVREPPLRRQIGLYAATAVTVGSIVGSGIFRSPHSVARELPSEGLMLAAWIVGGLLSMVGALALAELAVTHPRTGGLYVFIREGFGRRLAFVFGWASLTVIKPTVIASITSVFALYFCEAVGWSANAHLPVGLAAIGALTFVNWLGVREGTRTQTFLTTVKVVGILLLCFAAFALPHRGALPGSAPAEAAPLSASPLWLAFVAAMIPILFAYDGWTDSTYVAGEIMRPRRNLPIAIVGGTAIVIAIYTLTNLAYFSVLSPAEIATHEAVGSETVRRILGNWGGRALAVLVAVSTFGTISASILTGPRVTLAMASDGLFWKRGCRALAPVLARVALARGRGGGIRGRLRMVRDHVVALLWGHHRGGLPAPRAERASLLESGRTRGLRRSGRGRARRSGAGLPHSVLPAHPRALHPGHARTDRERPRREPMAGGGRDRGGCARIPDLSPLEGPVRNVTAAGVS